MVTNLRDSLLALAPEAKANLVHQFTTLLPSSLRDSFASADLSLPEGVERFLVAAASLLPGGARTSLDAAERAILLAGSGHQETDAEELNSSLAVASARYLKQGLAGAASLETVDALAAAVAKRGEDRNVEAAREIEKARLEATSKVADDAAEVGRAQAELERFREDRQAKISAVRREMAGNATLAVGIGAVVGALIWWSGSLPAGIFWALIVSAGMLASSGKKIRTRTRALEQEIAAADAAQVQRVAQSGQYGIQWSDWLQKQIAFLNHRYATEADPMSMSLIAWYAERLSPRAPGVLPSEVPASSQSDILMRLTQQTAQLTRQLTSLGAEIASNEGNRARLATEIGRLTSVKNEFPSMVAEQEQRIAAAQASVMSLGSRRQAKSAEATAASQRVGGLQGQADDAGVPSAAESGLAGAASQAAAALSTQKSRLAQENDQRARIGESLVSVGKDLVEAQQAGTVLSQIKTETDVLDRRLVLAKEDLSRGAQRLEQALARISDLERTLANTADDVTRAELQQRLNQERQEQATLESEQRQHTEEINKTESDLAEAARKRSAVESKAQDEPAMRTRQAEIEAQRVNCDARIESLSREVERATQDARAADAAYADCKAQREASGQEAERQLSTARAEETGVRAELAAIEKEIAEKQQQIQQAEKEIGALEFDQKRWPNDLPAKTGEATQADEMSSRMASSRRSLTEELAATRNEFVKLVGDSWSSTIGVTASTEALVALCDGGTADAVIACEQALVEAAATPALMVPGEHLLSADGMLLGYHSDQGTIRLARLRVVSGAHAGQARHDDFPDVRKGVIGATR